jgi:hypothetical protein
MTFFLFSAASVRLGCFLFRIGGKRSEKGLRKVFYKKYSQTQCSRKIFYKKIFVSKLWDTFANRTKNSRVGCFNKEEWERETMLEINNCAAVELKSVRLGIRLKHFKKKTVENQVNRFIRLRIKNYCLPLAKSYLNR